MSRQKSIIKKYELSPELQDRSVKFLERQYGGKEKAHQAARAIQLYYRNYRMNKQFKRIRSYSHAPMKDSFRQKALSDPTSQTSGSEIHNSEGTLVTPVIRIKKKKRDGPRVKSILIIDNINSLISGQSQMDSTEQSSSVSQEEASTSDLASLPVENNSLVLERRESETDNEQSEIQSENEDKQRTQSSVSETEHYVKVELVDNLEGSPGDTFLEHVEAKRIVPNGDIPRRPCRDTLNDESSVIESDESGEKRFFPYTVHCK